MAAFLERLGRRPGQRDPAPGDGRPAGEAAHPADPLHPAGLPADPPDAAEPPTRRSRPVAASSSSPAASAYDRSGGHAAIRATLHDGIKLPRAFRAPGFKTDLFDATDLAACRMYRTAGEVWLGLAKNAGEALAAPAMIVPMTPILLGGQVLPVILLALALSSWPHP